MSGNQRAGQAGRHRQIHRMAAQHIAAGGRRPLGPHAGPRHHDFAATPTADDAPHTSVPVRASIRNNPPHCGIFPAGRRENRHPLHGAPRRPALLRCPFPARG